VLVAQLVEQRHLFRPLDVLRLFVEDARPGALPQELPEPEGHVVAVGDLLADVVHHPPEHMVGLARRHAMADEQMPAFGLDELTRQALEDVDAPGETKDVVMVQAQGRTMLAALLLQRGSRRHSGDVRDHPQELTRIRSFEPTLALAHRICAVGDQPSDGIGAPPARDKQRAALRIGEQPFEE